MSEQSPAIWVCRHPQWIESSRCATWSGCDTGTPMPPDVMWTAIEYCPLCGETRQRPIQMNAALTGGEEKGISLAEEIERQKVTK